MEKMLKYNLTNYIGLAAYQLRHDLGYSQDEVASRTDTLTFKYIGKIERREVKNIKLKTLEDLSYGLHVSPSQLLALAEELERKSMKKRKKE